MKLRIYLKSFQLGSASRHQKRNTHAKNIVFTPGLKEFHSPNSKKSELILKNYKTKKAP